MKIHLIVLLCMFVEIHGCWKSKSAEVPAEVIEEVEASTIPNLDAARARTSNTAGKILVEAAELRSISEELYRLDTNSVGSLLKLNYQGQTTSTDTNDVAPIPLFSAVPPEVLKGLTISLFRGLLDNYVADVRLNEEDTRAEKTEISSFLDAIMATPLMKRTELFLLQKGFIKGSLRQQLDLIWFTAYSRSRGTSGSSGFEHVFLGELKNGEVSGLHNWIFFMKEESENDLNYKGYMKSVDLGNRGEILKLRFDWLKHQKHVGSLFIGTSPELEMALYTICFYTRPNAGCNLQMNNKRFRIKTYQQDYRGNKLIGSAFPEVF